VNEVAHRWGMEAVPQFAVPEVVLQALG
jgi:hypothetical protein